MTDPDSIVVPFSDALRRAWEVSTDMRTRGLDMEAVRTDISEEQATRWPRLALDVGPSQRYGLSFDQTTGQSSTQGRTGLTLGAGGRMTLYDGGRRAARLWRLRGNERALQVESRDVERLVAADVAGAYADALIDRALLSVALANARAQEEQLAQVRAFVVAGVRPPADTLAQRSALAGAQRGVVDATVAARLSRIALGRLLALDPDTPIALVDPTETPIQLLPLPEVGGEARPDVAAAEARLDAAQLGMDVARRQSAFSVEATAYTGTDFSSLQTRPVADGTEDVPFFNQLSSNRRASAGISLVFPILDQRATSVARTRAQVEIGRAEADLNEVRREATEDAARVEVELSGALLRLDAAEEQVTLANAYAAVQRERYRLGAGTLFEWSDAQARYVTAVAALEQARYTLWLARVQAYLNPAILL